MRRLSVSGRYPLQYRSHPVTGETTLSHTQGEESRPSVVVIDDEADLVLLVERLLERNDFRVVGTANDGQRGVEVVAETQPDAVLLDLAMPTVDGETALPSIVKDAPRTMVAIFSAHLEPSRAEQLLQRGAFAAYDKGDLGRLPATLAEDLEGFRRILAGEDDVPAWKHRYRRL